jgi:hypothetical protein
MPNHFKHTQFGLGFEVSKEALDAERPFQEAIKKAAKKAKKLRRRRELALLRAMKLIPTKSERALKHGLPPNHPEVVELAKKLALESEEKK